MSEPLLLAGYQAVFPRGFALPCFGTAPRPNMWSIADAEVQGDHQSRIMRFVPFESDHIVQLPAEDIVKVQVGDPWHDVFLLDDQAWVGTPGSILDQLGERFEELTAEAPLEALDLALAAGHADTSEVLRAAQAAVTELHGEDRARSWLSQLIIRPQARVEVRRRLREAGLDDSQNRVREIRVEQGPSGFRLSMPAQLADALKRAGRGEALNEAAAALSSTLSLDLQADPSLGAPRIGRIRVNGAQRTSPATIVAASGLSEGDAVSNDLLTQARERVLGMAVFEDVDVAFSGATVEIIVNERKVVEAVRFLGSGFFTESVLRDVVKVRAGALHSPAGVLEDAQRLEDFYRRQDLKADIEVRTEHPGGRLIITFDIDEFQGEVRRRPGEDILIWPKGQGARDVVRAMSPLDWSPNADRAFVIDAPNKRMRIRDRIHLTRVEIGSGVGPILDPDDYAVIVLVVDEATQMHDGLAEISRHGGAGRPAPRVLVAPTLPPDRPSEILRRHSDLAQYPAPAAMLDTSVVRSPFWTARPESVTSTRQVAEFILGAAMLISDDQIGSLMNLTVSKKMPLFSWAREQKFGRLALVSESNPWPLPGHDNEDRGFSVMMFDVGGRGPHTRGYARFGEPSGAFEAFATAAFSTALHGLPPPGSHHPRRDLPERLTSLLHAPDRAAFLDKDLGVRAAGGAALVTAESPSLELLLAADAMGVNVVRYTDIASMRRLGSASAASLLPQDVAIPPLSRAYPSGGLAVRGLDPRQISRLPVSTYEALTEGRKSPLSHWVRRLRTAVDQMEAAEVAVPFGATLEGAALRDEIALGFLNGEAPRQTRNASLSRQRQWTPPQQGLSRFIFGAVVARVVVDRLADDEVASGRVLTMDGDLAVPVLLTSRLFQVWVRVMCLASHDRFRLTNSAIETFPLMSGMEIIRVGPDESPALVFSDGYLRALAEDLNGELWTGPMIGTPADRPRGAVESELEEALLARFDLRPASTDIEVLDRLVNLTRVDRGRG